MALYAANTSVPVEQSRNEIERTLGRYGASAFGFLTDTTNTLVMFKVGNRAIRISIPKASGKRLNIKQLQKEDRRRWRALLLIIKSKLEAIASGIATFDNEFLPYTVMADGRTIGEWAAPQLDQIVSGSVQLMLGAGEQE